MERLIVRAFAVIQMFMFTATCCYLHSVFEMATPLTFTIRAVIACALLATLGHTRLQLSKKVLEEEAKMADTKKNLDALGAMMAKNADKARTPFTITDTIIVNEVAEKRGGS